MHFVKDGKPRDEFHLVQDLGNNPEAQEQLKRALGTPILKSGLEKLTKDQNLIQALLALWGKKTLPKDSNVPLGDLIVPFQFGLPDSMTAAEKKMVLMLKNFLFG